MKVKMESVTVAARGYVNVVIGMHGRIILSHERVQLSRATKPMASLSAHSNAFVFVARSCWRV